MKPPISRLIVHGDSMSPTLKEGDNIICFNWARFFGKFKKGNIVVVNVNGRSMVKRVRKTGHKGIFVIGDNKYSSTDSRYFGWVQKGQIIGKVVGI